MLTPSPFCKTIILSAALGFLLTGCSSGPEHHSRGDGPPGPAATLAALSMTAQETFFSDAILVEANLGHGFGSGEKGEQSGGGNGSGPGGGGGRRGGGGGRRRGGGGGGGYAAGNPAATDSSGDGPAPQIHESRLPPIALRLRLTNHGKETVEVTFVDCRSELGDFAVQPEKVALAPEQSAEPDSMNSRLGIPTEQLVLTLALKVGTKTETKTLTLRPKPAAPTTPPPPPPAPPAGSDPTAPKSE